MKADLGVPDLVAALTDLRDRFACDVISATYKTPGGTIVTIQLAGSLLTLEDDQGNLVSAPQELQP